MLLSSDSVQLRTLRGIARTNDLRVEICKVLLEDLARAIRHEIKVGEGALFLVEHYIASMGVVGHSRAHGNEERTVHHHYFLAGRILGISEDNRTVTLGSSGYVIYRSPWTLGCYPRTTKEVVPALNLWDFVLPLFPHTQYRPYSHQETTLVAVGGDALHKKEARAIRSRVRKWQKSFGEKVDITIP